MEADSTRLSMLDGIRTNLDDMPAPKPKPQWLFPHNRAYLLGRQPQKPDRLCPILGRRPFY